MARQRVAAKRRPRSKYLVMLVVLVACSTFASACEVIDQTWPGALGSAHYPLQHDYGLAVPIPGYENYSVQTCLIRGSDVLGRRDVCRVVLGVEEQFEWRNWQILSDQAPESYEYVSGYGCTIDTGSIAGCAAFITALSRGGRINLPGLTGCAERFV